MCQRKWIRCCYYKCSYSYRVMEKKKTPNRFSQNIETRAPNINDGPYDEINDDEFTSNIERQNNEINIHSETLARERNGEINISNYEEIDDSIIYKHEYEEGTREASLPTQVNNSFEDNGIYVTSRSEYLESEDYLEHFESETDRGNNAAPYVEIIEYEYLPNMDRSIHAIQSDSETLTIAKNVNSVTHFLDDKEIGNVKIYKDEYEGGVNECCLPTQRNNVSEDNDMYLLPISEYLEFEEYFEYLERETEIGTHDSHC